MATHADVKSPLHETVTTTATDYWNDSCSVEELTYAIANGAVGATSNPTIVGEVLKKEMHLWRERIGELIAADGTATEDELTWLLIEEMAVKGAELLLPVFEREGGRQGRLSIQTNPKFYRNAAQIVEQAIHFAPGAKSGFCATPQRTNCCGAILVCGVMLSLLNCGVLYASSFVFLTTPFFVAKTKNSASLNSRVWITARTCSS